MRKLTISLLLIWLVAAMLLPVPALAADCSVGQEYNSLYYSVVVDTYVAPLAGGYITRSRNGVDCSSNFQTPAIAGGTRYFTGTRLPTMAEGFAAAPLDFWIEAVPASGYSFYCWYNVPTSWIVGNRVHVQYNETFCDSNNGRYQFTAQFRASSVNIEFRSTTGIVYDVASGWRNIPMVPGSLTPLICHVAAAYESNYEFGGWVGDPITLDAITDMWAADTYLQTSAWAEGSGPFWLQPTLVYTGGETFTITFDNSTPPESGHCAFASIDTQQGVMEWNGWIDDSEGDYEFVRWDCINVRATTPLEAQSYFQLLSEDDGTVTPIVRLTAGVDIWSVVMGYTGSGSITPVSGIYNILDGTVMQIQAVAATNWGFDHWEGLPGGFQSERTSESIKVISDLTITAVFISSLPPGIPDPGSGSASATGIWGAFSNSLGSVGLNNSMGRAFLLVGLAAVVTLFARKDPMMRVVLPLGILGVGIIGNWVPLWIVVLLALGLAVGLLKFLSKSGVTGGSSE